jgi:high-affinity iron transporter
MENVQDSELWTLSMTVIFAREFVEAFVIIGNYRRLVQTSSWSAERKQEGIKTIWLASGGALSVAFIMILVTAVVLSQARKEVDGNTIAIIEGVSKVVASFTIATICLKIPKWFQAYGAGIVVSKKMTLAKASMDVLTLSELRFNVAWNIWREMAEIGIFLIPSFISTTGTAIPLSALSGIAIAIVFGGGIYLVSLKLTDKRTLSAFMATVIGLLSCGLFAYGLHEFEEVIGETAEAYHMGPGFSHNELPFVLIKPFGYSDHPSILQLCAFYFFLAVLVIAHVLQYLKYKRIAARRDAEAASASPAVEMKAGAV